MRPYYNYNDTKRWGVDWGLTLSNKFDQVDLSLGFYGLYSKAKNTKWNENVEYDWLKVEGADASALRGYKCIGYWNDEDEIIDAFMNPGKGKPALVNANTKPGDLKYVDQNGDGVIDSKDQVVLGTWSSPLTLGLNLQVAYKGFTLFVAGSGRFGGQGIKNNSYMWVYGDSKYSDVVRGRWTPETAATATYPRLTTQGSELNFVDSDYWMYNTDAFFLDKVQLTYDFPKKWFDGKFVKGLQAYIYGSSLATISKERKYIELNVGSAPQCRTYNFGVKVDF